jgi:hypothetical protein
MNVLASLVAVVPLLDSLLKAIVNVTCTNAISAPNSWFFFSQ